MLKEQLMKLKNALKYHDFENLVREWKEGFEFLYEKNSLDYTSEYRRIWGICSLLESNKAEELAKVVLFDAQYPKYLKEFYAFYILLNRLFVDSKMTKEEFFKELDNFIKEECHD